MTKKAWSPGETLGSQTFLPAFSPSPPRAFALRCSAAVTPEDPPIAPPSPVRRDSVIDDILRTRPDAARVLQEEFNLPCWDCDVRFSETLETGVSYTGLDPDAVIARLNQCPWRPLGPEHP
jgi:hypothetical protein